MSSKSTKRGPSGPVKAYLTAYNLASAAGWSYVLFLTVQHLFSAPKAPATASEQALEHAQTLAAQLLALLRRFLPFLVPPPSTREQVREALPQELHGLWERAASTYSAVGDVTAVVQTGAVLEIVHVLLGLVKSPLVTTVMQVSSRVFIVWGVVDRYSSAQTNPLYTSMVIAWSTTEVIRYLFYASSLAGIDVPLLQWLRYTTFYVLYPLGAGSEAFLTYASLPTDPLRGESLDGYTPYDYLRLVFFGIWWPGLYVMYTYMIKQRRKVLGGAAKPKVKAA